MKVFVTGAAGFIGRACVKDLKQHGHEVLGLARSDANVAILEELGAEVIRGSLEDTESLKKGAAAADGVIHLGFVHDFSKFERACEIDRAAISAMAEGLGEGSNKALVIVSGTLAIAGDELADEDAPEQRDHLVLSARALSRDLIQELSAKKGIRGSVIRLTPSVHDKVQGGFGPMICEIAFKSGKSYYVEGANACWPGVHVTDAASLLRLALEKGRAGATYHAVAEEEVSLKELAEIIGKKLDIPVEGVTADYARQALGFAGMLIGRRNPVSSKKTRQELGWEPTNIGWLEDYEANLTRDQFVGKASAH
jgi:nucleoside-diphosphate-sugar epimerase